MINRFETYFDANYTILKSLGLFESLAFVILSTRENIRLIARASWIRLMFSGIGDLGFLKKNAIYLHVPKRGFLAIHVLGVCHVYCNCSMHT